MIEIDLFITVFTIEEWLLNTQPIFKVNVKNLTFIWITRYMKLKVWSIINHLSGKQITQIRNLLEKFYEYQGRKCFK